MVPDDAFDPPRDPWIQRHGSALALAALAAFVALGFVVACSMTGCRAEVRVEARPTAAPATAAPAEEHDGCCPGGVCGVPPVKPKPAPRLAAPPR